ncbi:unnamed protein product [Lepeophtheirus salmonis]|uniref:(salmon louse) hypothetical protein n=1 Tax=Lepeophtheirus salmonis TaxID=72036 RepID=A0A7R8CJM2_LEPSM|nr:unnamed protein product [Lepeophtheirus salmonis]CAF2812548.1 unnamed protein product [Lepeophtheirus salmonis]
MDESSVNSKRTKEYALMEELSDLLNLLGSAVGRALQGEENVEELDGKLVEAHSFLKRLSCVPDEGEPDRSRSSELLSASSLQEDQADKLIELCKDTLSHEDVGESSKKLGAQLLVEIARTNTGRRIMRTTGLVPTLSAVLESNCPLETAVQICRVLDCLIHLHHHLAKNSDKSQDPGQRLPVILPRFLLNFTSSNCPEFAEKIAEIGFIDTILISFFVCICEGPTVIKIFHDQADITPAITHILNHTTSPEVTEVALELIRFLVCGLGFIVKTSKEWPMYNNSNFACSEENSVTLVANGTSKLLIRLLCSLRNLTVNPGSRTQLLNEGLLEPCIALTESLSPIPSYSVISKLVPVIRLLVDGSKTASLRIGEDRSLLSKYTEWGSEDNQWLKSASGRLLATLVKNSQSVEVMKNVVEVGGMPLITMMLISHHQKMLNESLITLVLMANVLPKDIVVAQLYTDLIINGIKSSLTESEHPVKVKKNALTLVSSLLKVRPEQFKSMLKDLNFLEALEHESIKDLSEAIQLRDSIENDC